MRNAHLLIFILSCIAFTACTTELLHSELSIEVVPERVPGAQPYYTNLPQPRPTFGRIPDTLSTGKRVIGNYLTTIVPYEGIAIWKVDDSSPTDTLPISFLRLPGLLDYDYDRNSPILLLSQYTAHYELDLGTSPPIISGQIPEPEHFEPYRFLASTLGVQGYTYYSDYYLNCPDPDSILAGFRFETLNTPTCKYD